MDDLLLYGPPGTGKTTQGIRWLEQRIEEGADLYRAAFVSFTNAAVDEARYRLAERFDIIPEQLPYSRTLHSLCKRSLGIHDADWLADEHLAEFAEKHGYDLQPHRARKADEDDLETISEKNGRDAVYLQIWDFARHRLIDNASAGWEAFAEYSPEGTAYASASRFGAFVEDYEAWKQTHWLRDQTDLLTEYLQRPEPLPVSVAVVDECQDLSPLMWEVTDRLFADAECRATLGDDDQAIYSYAGADPRLMNRRKARQQVKLCQSYRLPRTITEAALAIIDENQNRERKQILPTAEEGEAGRVSFLEDLDLLNGESWFVLVRNWKLLDQVLPRLEYDGIPYRIAGGKRYSPWSDRGPLRAVRTILKLSNGEPVKFAELQPLVAKTAAARGERDGAWVYGSKSRLEKRILETPDTPVTWRELPDLGLTEWGFERLMGRDLSLLTRDISQRDLTAYESAIRRGTLDREVQLSVSSIHGKKGQEADNVVCLMGCTGGPARAMLRPWRLEEERRVAYVGITRARKRAFGLMAQPAAGVYPYELFGI